MNNWMEAETSLRLTYAALFSAIFLPTTLHAQVESEATAATVRVIKPTEARVLIGDLPWNANGPAVTRWAVSRSEHGSIHLDIYYNTYRKGTTLSIPYAYNTDEFCFAPSGRILMLDDGEPFIFKPGMLMWRPAGGVTRAVEMLEDTVTICAMAPPPLNGNSNKLAPGDVGKWEGDPAKKPIPHYFSMKVSPIVPAFEKTASAGVIEREVVSKRKDGSALVNVTYTTLKRGARLVASGAGEEICWVETGSLSLTSKGQQHKVMSQSFFYRPEGVAIDRIKAKSAASVVCLTGPAAF